MLIVWHVKLDSDLSLELMRLQFVLKYRLLTVRLITLLWNSLQSNVWFVKMGIR